MVLCVVAWHREANDIWKYSVDITMDCIVLHVTEEHTKLWFKNSK